MEAMVLTKNEFSNINKLKKQYSIFRATSIKAKSNLALVEFMNKDRIFRGFGTTTKKAYKNAKKVLKSFYKVNT